MSQISTLDFAEMSRRVYNLDAGKDFDIAGYECRRFREGMSWGVTNTDFKGCVYASQEYDELVVAFQGTDPSKLGDVVADLQIVITGFIGMLPQYCGAALRLFERAAVSFPDRKISLTGHSLGGAIAQVIGHWTNTPFATFNAPGMYMDIQRSKLSMILGPNIDALNSIMGGLKGSALAKQSAGTGRNFRNVMDPVSMYGSHYGPVTRFWGTGLHSMDDVFERVRSSRWANINPFDPKNKEWGEFD